MLCGRAEDESLGVCKGVDLTERAGEGVAVSARDEALLGNGNRVKPSPAPIFGDTAGDVCADKGALISSKDSSTSGASSDSSIVVG